MRPPQKLQSGIRAPLNRILGTEANVRLLRVMSVEPEALTRTELGRRAGLGTKGAHLAASRLEDEGLLSRVGSGSRQQVAYNSKHPLASVIQELFLAERERVETLLDGLRHAIEAEPLIDAAWLQGSFALEEDQTGDAITLVVLAKGQALPKIISNLRAALSELEAQHDVLLELRGLTRADLATASGSEIDALKSAKPLWGPGPMTFLHGAQEPSSRGSVSHAMRDVEAAALATEIARRVTREPELRTRAIQWIAKRMQRASPQERHELKEWEQILKTSSPARLSRFLRDPGERATRLRQTLPFVELFTEHERSEILKMARER